MGYVICLNDESDGFLVFQFHICGKQFTFTLTKLKWQDDGGWIAGAMICLNDEFGICTSQELSSSADRDILQINAQQRIFITPPP